MFLFLAAGFASCSKKGQICPVVGTIVIPRRQTRLDLDTLLRQERCNQPCSCGPLLVYKFLGRWNQPRKRCKMRYNWGRGLRWSRELENLGTWRRPHHYFGPGRMGNSQKMIKFWCNGPDFLIKLSLVFAARLEFQELFDPRQWLG